MVAKPACRGRFEANALQSLRELFAYSGVRMPAVVTYIPPVETSVAGNRFVTQFAVETGNLGVHGALSTGETLVLVTSEKRLRLGDTVLPLSNDLKGRPMCTLESRLIRMHRSIRRTLWRA